MFADASGFAVTTRGRDEAPRAGRPGPGLSGRAERSALGPRPLAHCKQRAGFAVQQDARVGPRHGVARP